AEIECARAERVALATGHEARQIGLALDHFDGRMPVRPLGHARDALGARPGEALTANADAVSHRLTVAEHEIKVSVGGIDDDRAGGLFRPVIDHRAPELRRQLLARTGFRTLLRRQRRVDIVVRLTPGRTAWRRIRGTDRTGWSQDVERI